MDRYRAFQNAIALSQINRIPDIPKASLAIGDAEHFESMNVMTYGNVWNREAYAAPNVEKPASNPIEKMGILGQGAVIENADVGGDFYLGEPLGSD